MSRSSLLVASIFYANPDTYPPIVNSSRLMAGAGLRVRLLCRATEEQWGVAYAPGVTVRRFAGRGSSLQQYARFVSRTLRQGRGAKVFIGHDMHGLFPARLLASIYRRPLVYHCHELVDESNPMVKAFGGGRVWEFQNRFARTADLVIVPDADRAALLERSLQLPQPPLVVGNAPLHRSMPASGRLERALAERGKRFGKIVFRQSSLGPDHALEATIRSIPLWSGSDWGFVVMGPGKDEYLSSLSELATEVGVGERFVALPPVNYDEVAEFTVGGDIGHALYGGSSANSRFNATASNKLAEYLQAGLPLLVSHRPALQALVEKNACGLSADEGSPQSIADAVNALLSDPQKTQAMSEAARHAFDSRFCYERQFAPALQRIEELAARA